MKNKLLFSLIWILACNIFIIGCKKEGDEVPTPTTVSEPMFKIGQNLGGGVVFYVDETGMHGLVVDTSNTLGKKVWCAGSLIPTNAVSTELGMGAVNSETIVASVGQGNYAALACEEMVVNGYDDWFLPSKEELHFLYSQKSLGKINGLNQDFYWSSSETSQEGAWSQSFVTGAASSTHKSGSYGVCAVRAF
ncbi:MAG: DUF1566 domain-containing protein [Bacteroidia bacterium]